VHNLSSLPFILPTIKPDISNTITAHEDIHTEIYPILLHMFVFNSDLVFSKISSVSIDMFMIIYV